MKRKITYTGISAVLALAMFCAILPNNACAESYTTKVAVAAKRVFGEAAVVSTGSAALTAPQIAAVKSKTGYTYPANVSYYVVTVNGTRVGFGIVDDVKGKVKMITYLLFVDTTITVKDMEVLAYREPYGGEIKYKSFRDQYKGKDVNDPIKVGVDIKNISGATISTNAVSRGVRKLLAVMDELNKAGKLK